TLKSKYVAQTRIQDDGSFNCEIPVSPDTVPALYFSLAGSRTQLQLSPGKSYEFYIPATDPSQLGITENNDTADRWYALAQFETYYTNYVLENEKALRSPDYKKVIQAFAKDAMEKFGNHPDPFVAATVRYRVAGTQLALQIGSARQIISEHVAGKPVLYDHPEYMDFFM